MKGKVFTKDEQLDLFGDLFGSQELIELYIQAGKVFCEEAQLKLFELKAPFNEDMIILYIEQGQGFSEQAEVKLFDLPSAEMVLETYCLGKLNPLQPTAQIRLLEEAKRFPQFVNRYIRAYRKTPYLCDTFVMKAKEKGLMK